MSQEVLAERCGVSFQQIQKYENGSNRITFSRLVRMARALDCRVSELTAVLDVAEPEATDMEMLSLMRNPGALDLLDAYEKLDNGARRTLIEFLRALVPSETVAPRRPGRPVPRP